MTKKAPSFWSDRGWRAWLLWPLVLIFRVLAGFRRTAYCAGWRKAVRLPVPVVIVGNIAVGGSGKTPVVVWLAKHLAEAGWQPGIISRGYGGNAQGVQEVKPDSDPAVCGDEPVLLAKLTGCPVFVGRDRPAVGAELLKRYSTCNVILSDDGMQHYRLARDVEIAVVDQRTLGNGWCLPAGPLREPLARLREVDVVIAHGALSQETVANISESRFFAMRLEGDQLRSLADPLQTRSLASFAGQRVHALAGIGRPERFFDQLKAAGLEVVSHAFTDHHRFEAADLAFAPDELKIMTSKDAVKCSAFAPENTWEFPVQARIESGAVERIVEKLNGSKAA